MELRPARTVLSVGLAMALLGACGENSDDETGAGVSTTAAKAAPTSTAAAAGAKALAVTGVDYAFTGVPATVPAGTTVSLTNASNKEVHELVALRVKDGETRPAGVLLQLPEAERDAAAEFKGVLFAFPGEAGVAPQGPVTLSQPGRYLFVCTIPTGADPAAYRAAAQNPGPPPQVPGGPPHVVAGMLSELTVT